MGRRRKLPVLEEPTEGDFMVELPNGDAKCFLGTDAYSKMEQFLKTVEEAEAYKYVGWEHYRSIKKSN